MVNDIRQESPAGAVGYMLLGVCGGLGLDMCAKALLVDYSLEQFVFLRSLIGVSIYAQSFMWNPPMFPNDPLRMSGALEFNIGNHTTPFGQGSGLTMWPIGNVIAQPGGQIAIDFSID